MNIICHELKKNYSKIIILTIISLLITLLAQIEMKTINYSGDITALFAKFPKIIRAMFGFNDFDLSKNSGIYLTMFFYTAIIFSFYAISLGCKATSIMKANYTDCVFTFTKTRTKVLLNKTSSAILIITILTIANFLTSLVVLLIYKETSFIYLLLAHVMLYITLLILYSIGMLLGAILKNYKQSSTVCAVLIALFYFLNVLANSFDSFSFLNYLSPIYYCTNKYLVENQINYYYLGICIPAFVLFTFISIKVFKHKDL